MLYAIVSDIHANAQAWAAVQLDFASLGADRVICLGDVVGYGPDPADVLASTYASVHHFVLGNHDAALCGRMNAGLFSGDARTILDWTRGRLDRKARALMATWPLSLRGPGFRCAHGEFAEPASFRYVLEPETALPSWARTRERLLFVGHSHCPGVYLLGASGTPRRVEAQDLVVESDRRTLVNVGSVGQPRDGDPRACYCLYDPGRRAVYFRRIPFDLDAYRAAVCRAGRPGGEDPFLAADPRREAAPVRPRLFFRPPDRPEDGARGADPVRDLAALNRRVRRYRGATVALAAALVLGAASAGVALHRYARRSVVIGATRASLPRATDIPPDRAIVALPLRASPPGAPIPGWEVRLGHRRRQAAQLVVDPEEGSVLRLRSRAPRAPLRVAATPVLVAPGDRLTAEALFRRADGFAGRIALGVRVERETAEGPESLDHFVLKEPNLRRRDGWMGARETFTLPAGATRAQIDVRGTFAGEVEVREITLRRR